MFYIRTAEKLQRTAPWVESFDGGIEKLRRIIIHDDLGICKDLDAEMDALIGTYEDEWKLAVEDPDLQRHFRQFANTVSTPWSRMNKLTMKDERRGAIEMIEERGQMRAADWPKDFPGQKFDAKDLRTPDSTSYQSRFGSHGHKHHVCPSFTAPETSADRTRSCAVRYGDDSQLAIFHVPKKGYFATQQMCPHKRAFVLDHGIIGDDKDGNLYVSCP
jgi:nitrite reductase (NAD(P)H)